MKLRPTLLRVLSFTEGFSLLVLMGIAVPLKHFGGKPEATRIVGLVHGLLFLAYVVALADAYGTRRVSSREALVAVLASLLPGGAFVFAYRLARTEAAKDAPTDERVV